MEEIKLNNNSLEEAERYQTLSLEKAKEFIKANIVMAAKSFITIGYYLKYIRDNEMFKDDGYTTIWEFAQEEYGLSMSTASRYMKMNDRFSKDGNSPYIQDAYKEFGKSQLQEMMYLDDRQLEQVTPGTQVMEIRNIRKRDSEESIEESPEPIQIPGQIGIEDFPEAWPEAMALFEEHTEAEQKPVGYQLPVSELFPDVGESIAKSQQSLVVDSQQEKGVCTYRQDHNCTLTESQKLTAGDGEHCSSSCCWKCIKHGECKLECNSSANRPDTTNELNQLADVQQEELISEPSVSEYTSLYFLEEQREKLNELLKSIENLELEKTPRKAVERQKIIVAALALMVSDQEQISQEEIKEIEQPELPEMKNNEQRTAFIDGFETWPLWIETKQTGERYYRYDLPDGTSIVVKVYHSMLFDYKAVGKNYEDRYKEGYGRNEYYLLQEGKFFRDSTVNRSALVEKLKEIQK